MKTSQIEIVLACYHNAISNATTPIGHNIAFSNNIFEIDIDNEEITSLINVPTLYLTN